MESKIQRKILYLRRLAEYFSSKELLHKVNQIQTEIAEMVDASNPEMRLFALKCKNNKLRFIKKKYENLFYNDYSNVTAFHIKRRLKPTATIGLYNELFDRVAERELQNSQSGTQPAVSDWNEDDGPLDLMDINLPVYEFKLHSLVDSSHKRLASMQTSLQVPDRVLRTFLEEVLIVYNHVPYHNFSHGFAVFQVFNFFFEQSQFLNQIFSPDEKFIGLVACLSHDLGHRKSHQLAKTTSSRPRRRTACPCWRLTRPCSRNFTAKCS